MRSVITSSTLAALVLVCTYGYGQESRSEELSAKQSPQEHDRLAYVRPEDAGFDSERLDVARALADSVGSAAVMILADGHVVQSWGDVTRKYDVKSVRKSLVSGLYGIAVDRGEIDLQMRLTELDIDGLQSLTQSERQARLLDLLTARSGIYLPAAFTAPVHARNLPERGSHAPGEHWYYNNWDFNVAGVVYEHLTGSDLYDAFKSLIADPVGMEDYTPKDGYLVFEPSKTPFPAQTFWMSARDLARYGQLYLQNGTWQGASILSPEWVRESTSKFTDFGNGAGYAYLWWVYARGAFGEGLPHLNGRQFFAADGAGGQRIVVIPSERLGIVHQGDVVTGDGVSEEDTWAVIDKILAARTGEPDPEARLLPWAPPSQSADLREWTWPPDYDLSPQRRESMLGTYDLGRGMEARVFLWKDRLFVNVGGRLEGEILPVAENRFVVLQAPKDQVRFEWSENGDAAAIVIAVSGRTMRGEKVVEDR